MVATGVLVGVLVGAGVLVPRRIGRRAGVLVYWSALVCSIPPPGSRATPAYWSARSAGSLARCRRPDSWSVAGRGRRRFRRGGCRARDRGGLRRRLLGGVTSAAAAGGTGVGAITATCALGDGGAGACAARWGVTDGVAGGSTVAVGMAVAFAAATLAAVGVLLGFSASCATDWPVTTWRIVVMAAWVMLCRPAACDVVTRVKARSRVASAPAATTRTFVHRDDAGRIASMRALSRTMASAGTVMCDASSSRVCDSKASTAGSSERESDGRDQWDKRRNV